MFINDILHIVILDFSADIIDFDCKNLLSRFGQREIMVSLGIETQYLVTQDIPGYGT